MHEATSSHQEHFVYGDDRSTQAPNECMAKLTFSSPRKRITKSILIDILKSWQFFIVYIYPFVYLCIVDVLDL